MRIKSTVMLLSLLVAIGASLAFKPVSVSACSCVGPVSVQEEFNRKTVVFAGKVKSITNTNQGIFRSSADPVRVSFEVKQVWKGELPVRTDVYTASGSVSCGYDGFAANRDYIVFAYWGVEGLKTGLCDRTKLLSAAFEELAVLGTGYGPSGAEHSARGGYAGAALGIGVAGLVAGAIIAWVMVRRRGRGRS
ncbi:hypothetical protein [Paenibacillus sp. GYB003]|uniref:hypothetical protein n=1 Tax=Paenibacillus sp. GYB003 TaxID=2994392 RepID=UPI002F96159C